MESWKTQLPISFADSSNSRWKEVRLATSLPIYTNPRPFSEHHGHLCERNSVIKKKAVSLPVAHSDSKFNSGFRICSKCHQKEHAPFRRHETLNLVANRAEKTAICNQIFWQKDFETRQQQIRMLTYLTSKEELQKFCKEKCTSRWRYLRTQALCRHRCPLLERTHATSSVHVREAQTSMVP